MKKILWLAHAGQSSNSLSLRLSKEDHSIHWMFFGQDYSCFLDWQKALSGSYAYVPIKDKLSKVVVDLRTPFLNLMVQLGRQYDSVAWWGSRVAERNTMVSPLFLHCCYLKTFEQIFSSLDGTAVVVGEDWALLESMAELAKVQGCEVHWFSHRSSMVRRSLVWAVAVGRLIKFLIRSFKAKGAGTDIRPVPSKPITLIHTYSHEGCLAEGGVFKDAYFPGLAAWLERQGKTVVTMPVLFNIRRSLNSAWAWFRASKQDFLNPYFYYQMSDYAFVMSQSIKQGSMLGGDISLAGMNVGQLFRSERDRFLFACLDNLLYERLPLRLVQAGFALDEVIMPFENMIDEKLLILGLKQFSPDTKTTGFQHSIIYSTMLCQFVPREESKFAPYPQRIVCNGEYFRDILIKEGLPAEQVVVGPALRFNHLWSFETDTRISNDKADILIALPLVIGDMNEVLIKTVQAFGEMPYLKILVKAHPMMSEQFLNDCPLIQQMPKHFQRINGSMSEWIFKVKVMVTIGTSSIYEALAAGVPTVVIGRDHALDLNPLDFYPEFNQVFTDSTDIRKETLRLLEGGLDQKVFEQRSRQILKSSFHPVTEEK